MVIIISALHRLSGFSALVMRVNRPTSRVCNVEFSIPRITPVSPYRSLIGKALEGGSAAIGI